MRFDSSFRSLVIVNEPCRCGTDTPVCAPVTPLTIPITTDETPDALPSPPRTFRGRLR